MKLHATWENSVDHDQLHSDLHCFQKRIYPGLSRIMVGSNLMATIKAAYRVFVFMRNTFKIDLEDSFCSNALCMQAFYLSFSISN